MVQVRILAAERQVGGTTGAERTLRQVSQKDQYLRRNGGGTRSAHSARA
jgi:hypothetical protein